MPTYTENGQYGHPVNISALVAGGTATGPLPRLGNGLGAVNVYMNHTANQNIDGSGGATVAFGLLSCAAVIYASTDPAANALAHVHHAGAGHVTNGDVLTALAAIGGAPANVVVIYAHPKPSDSGYTGAIATIAGHGIPAAHIIEIPNLSDVTFGINSLGQVGC